MVGGNRQRGQLRLVTGIEREGRVAQPGSFQGSADAGISQAADGLASEFDKIGAQISSWADKAAAREGQAEGELAGRDPSFSPRRDGTIRGEAYDRAGLATAATRIQTEVDTDLEKLAAANRGNAKGFKEGLEAKRGVWQAGVPPELLPTITHQFGRAEVAFMRRERRAALARQEAEQKASVKHALTEGLKGLHQRAFDLGTGPSASRILSADIAQLRTILSQPGVDGKPLYTKSQIDGVLAGAKQEVVTAQILGQFDRLGDLAAKKRFIDGIEADWKKSAGIAAVYDLNGFRRITSQLQAQYRRDEIAERANSAGVLQALKGVQRLAEKGFAPPPNQLAGIKAQVADAGSPEARAALLRAEDLFSFQATARMQTPADLNAYLAQERRRLETGGATEHEVERLELGEKMLTEMRRTLEEDPWSWMTRIGLAPTPVRWGQTLDDGSGGGPVDLAVVDLGKRLAQADAIAQRYGIAPPIWTADDRKALAGVVTAGGAPLVQITKSIAEAFGSRAPEAFKALGSGRGTPSGNVLALMGSLVANGGAPGVVEEIANGLAYRRLKEFKTLVPDAKTTRPAVEAAIGVDTLRAMPQTVEVLREMAGIVYDVRARREGWTDFRDDKFGEIVQQLLGEREVRGVTYGGIGQHRAGWFDGASRTSVLVPGEVRQDRFDDVIALINAADLEGTGQVPHSDKGEKLRADAVRRGTWVSLGEGRYWIALGDPKTDPQWLLDKQGRRLAFNLNVMLPRLRRRNGALFLGGN